jgi:glycosyltransferase involved in cell wall biosynthesis
MHILLIHQAFAALDEPGGTRHHELARYLVEKGHRVTIIASPISYLTGRAWSGQDKTSQGTAQSQETPGLTILRVYTYPALHRSFVHRVISFISFMLSAFIAGLHVAAVDVVWGTSPPIFQAAAAWALARLKRVPYLLEVRDLWPDFAIAVGVLRHPLLIRLAYGLERFLYRHADQVMVNSPGFIKHVTARGAHRITLVPNGADPRMFDPELSGKEFRTANQLSAHFIAMYAGAHGLSNDLGVLIDAAQLLQQRSDIAIVLLGDGKEKPALLQRARQLGLTNLVFLPPRPKTEMAQALAAADACIAILKPIPLYATVYPNKVFDYMAAGKPVILAIDGVIRQVVESVQSGLAVPPGDAEAIARVICQLADDPATGKVMGLRGRQYVETHFDRAVLADQLERVLQNLVNS